MKSSTFFQERKEGVAKLVEIRDSGKMPDGTDCSWSKLEVYFGLDGNNGMSALRVYQWATGKKSAPALKTATEVAAEAIAEAVVATVEVTETQTPKVKKWPKGETFPKHKMFKTLLTAVKAGVMVFMSGPAGSGKTSAGEMVAKELGLSFYPMSVGSQTSASELVGYMNATGAYVRTIFREAFQNGGLFLLDEIDSGNPNVLTRLNAALANDYCSFPDGVVKRHANFRCIAAGNTWGSGADRQYVGRNPLDAATKDRFTKIVWDYDTALELKIAGNADWTRRVQAIRKAVWKHGIRVLVTPRASIRGAKLLKAGLPQNVVEDMEIFNELDAQTKAKILAEVGTAGMESADVNAELVTDTAIAPATV